MKKIINTEHILNAPIENIWSNIKKGDGVENWIPIIKDSKLTSDCQRLCHTQDGAELVETFLSSDATNTFLLGVNKQNAFPGESILATMRLERIEDSKTKLYWDLELSIADEMFTEFKQNIEGLYQVSASNLESISKN